MYFLALEISDLEKNTRESAFDPERGHRRRDFFFAFVIINDGAPILKHIFKRSQRF